MKKFIAVLTLLVALAATSLAACNKGGGGNNSESSPDTESSSVHTHSMQYFPEQAATCVTSGRHAYYSCGSCGKTFSDENGEVPITSGDITIPATGHKYEGGYCENCDGIDPSYKGFAIGKEITGVAVDEHGVLSWSKIRSASKYEIVYAVGKENKKLAVDKRAASADITKISDFPLKYGKNYLTVKAYEKAQSGEETEISSLNLIVKNLNSGYEAANADYEDKFVTASGFTADEKGAIHKDVVVDGRTMPTIKKDISVSDGYTLAFYYTASDRENDLNRINRFTRELSDGANRYYAAVLSDENLVKTYDIVLHGVKEVGMEFAKESVTTESDGTKVSSLEYYFTQMQKTALQGDYIDINGLYEKIPEGYVIRDDNWNIYEKDGDYIMPYDSADVNCYYAAEEKTVRAEADEFKYYAQTFYISKVNDRSSSHYDYMNNKYVFKFDLTPKIYDDKGTEIVYNELYVPGDVIGNKTQVSSFGFATVKRLIIGRGITTLPQQAFYNVKNLEYVALPNTLTSAGNWLFPKAQKGTLKIYLEKNNENGFSDKWNYVEGSFDVFTTYYKSYNATCTVTAGQYSIAVGENGATVVGANLGGAWYLEDVVREVRLGYKTYKVTGYADNSLSDVTNFTIPSFIEEMNLNAFSEKLINIFVDKNNENYSLLDGILYNKEMTEILYVPGGYVNYGTVQLADNIVAIQDDLFAGRKIQNVAIGKNTTQIGANAFKGCPIKTISGESVQIVGDRAFKDCSALTTADFPKLKTVGESSFYGCNVLTAISFADDAESIGDYAFYGCSGLTSVTIGNGVTSIGSYAFFGCRGLMSITIPDGVTSIGDEAFRGCSGLTSVIIGNGVTSIGHFAFYDCSGLTSIAIPDGVTSIGSYAFSGCSGLTSITIPNSVTLIGNYAFYNCSGLTSVIIGNGVTSMGNSAFRGCSGLTSITIPDSVTSIGNSAFYGCSRLESITLPFVGADLNGTENTHFGYIFGTYSSSINGDVPSSLKTVIISNDSSVTSIGYQAFYNCSGLTSITIPDSVTTIGYQAFYNCSGLTSITIPDGVTSIGDLAFYHCSGLTSITIPDGVTSIGNSAFRGCSGLTSVIIGNGVTSIGKYAFLDCSRLESITLPFVGAELNGTENTHFGYIFGAGSSSKNSDYVPSSLRTVIISNDSSVTSIGLYAFENCSGLTSITIPDGVTSIGDSAFKGCRGLTSITIPDGVTSIGSYAFSGCRGLTGITIPDRVTSIGRTAFYNCSGLTNIIISDSVTTIGSSAFEGCSSLENITLPFIGAKLNGTENTHFGYIFGASSFSENSKNVPSSLKTVIISNDGGVTSIGNYAFYDCSGLTSITIPDSVTTIGRSAFDGCSGLSYNEYGGARYLGNENNKYAVLIKAKSKDITDCTINEKCKVICSSAFYNCSGLTSITIPNSVTSIGSSAFEYCSGLTNVTIGDGVTSIGDLAFYRCSGLTSITIPDGVTSIGNSAFNYCSGLTSITIPDSVTSIGNSAFGGCSGLTSITIPDGVTSIGSAAFRDCGRLESITLPFVGAELNGTENTHFGYIFGAGSSSENSNYVPSNLKTVIISNDSSVTSIGNSAFSGCNGLKSVTIGDGVTSIGSSAFSGCNSLESITLPFIGAKLNGTENTHFGYIFGAGSYKENSKYVPSSLKTVIISNDSSVTSIGSYAFYNCSELTNVTIGNGVTSIYREAFEGCSGLTNIIISDSVTYVGSSVFAACSRLSYNEDDWARYLGNEKNKYVVLIEVKSKDITDYAINENCKVICSYAFSGCSGLTSITIPDSVTSIGDSAFYGCSGLTNIIIPDSVTTIGYSAFCGCSGLTSITIPDSVTIIGSSAFGYCSGLTSITLGNGVTKIGRYFASGSKLSEIRYNGTIEKWESLVKTLDSEWKQGLSGVTVYCTDGNTSI